METTSKADHKAIKSLLDKAVKDTLRSQDLCVEAMKSLSLTGNEDYLTNSEMYCWDRIQEAMEGECYPPTWQDREEILGDGHTKSPVDLEIKAMGNQDYAGDIHFINLLNEQYQRLHATKTFFEFFNGKPEDKYLNFIFYLWTRLRIRVHLSEELLNMGMAEEYKAEVDMISLHAQLIKILTDNNSLTSPESPHS